MDRNWSSRVFAAALFGVVLGLYIHHDYVNWNRLGREAFMAHEVQRFDLYMVQPRPTLFTVFGATIAAAGAFALYESIAIGISAILSRVLPEGRSVGLGKPQ